MNQALESQIKITEPPVLGTYSTRRNPALSAALVNALAEITDPTKDSEAKVDSKTGRSFSFSYASLNEVLAQARPILHKHGLAILFLPADLDAVICRLIHTSGEYEEATMPVVMGQGSGPQAYGSALTYARRYCLKLVLNLADEEDDDGNAAEGNDARIAKRPPKNKDSTPPARPNPGTGDAGARYQEARKELSAALRAAGIDVEQYVLWARHAHGQDWGATADALEERIQELGAAAKAVAVKVRAHAAAAAGAPA